MSYITHDMVRLKMLKSLAQLETDVWARGAEYTSKIREHWSSACDPQAADCHWGH